MTVLPAHYPYAAPPDRQGLPRWVVIAALLFLFSVGLGIRLYDLTDPPLDAPMRQLRSAIIARGMYYQMLPGMDPVLRQQAIDLWQGSEILEPPLFERLVAVTYWISGSERIWIPRLYSILFWMVGAGFLYSIARRLGGEGGALISLGFFLLLPLGVYQSRLFQPDPLMVMSVLIAVWGLVNWQERQGWRSALLAGVLGGLAILIKVTAVFFVGAVAVALVAASGPLGQVLRSRKVWAVAGLMLVIPGIYYILGIGERSQGYFLFWNVEYAGLLKETWFYVRWLENLNNLIGLESVWLALAGLAVIPRQGRPVGIGLWVGYFLFGMAFPFQIHTHDYYNLILAAILPLSFAALAGIFVERLLLQPRFWQVVFVGVVLALIIVQVWNERMTLYNTDSRVNWKAWERIGQELPRDGTIIALTHDYGLSIQYFAGMKVGAWPTGQDLSAAALRGGNQESEFRDTFKRLTDGFDYFLVTYFVELDNQPELKSMLHDHYPVYLDGDGYLVYDLRHPMGSP